MPYITTQGDRYTWAINWRFWLLKNELNEALLEGSGILGTDCINCCNYLGLFPASGRIGAIGCESVKRKEDFDEQR